MERPQAVRTRTGRLAAAMSSQVVVLLLAAAAAAPAQAAPGDLDPTFSGDGKQTTSFGFGTSTATAIVRQPDGKLVVAGTDDLGGSGDFALARYHPNGSLDPSFSGDGKQRTDFAGDSGFDQAMGVALQSNGKIVVVGSGGPNGDFALARYNPNGSLDTSFSGDGKQTTDFGAFDKANGVKIQPDGRIVLAGRGGGTGLDGNFALARYNPNGSLDTSFSADGKQTADFGGNDEAKGVALQANGRIVAVGRGPGGFALARYNPNGSLDTSFSGDGRQTTGFAGFTDATGVVIQGDGKIVAAGVSSPPSFALARYNPNGSLDTSFSGDGKQTTGVGGPGGEVTGGVALQADGKIVVVGRGGGDGDFALARYNPHGALDTSFSGDGKQTTDFGGFDGASAVAVQPDGKIVAVGHAGSANGFDDFGLGRYNPNGSLDPSFSGDGRQRTDFGGPDIATGLALQGDGRIVVVGGGGNSSFFAPAFVVARYNPNGSLDPTFSGDGKQRTDFAGSEHATAVAIQADGKIVAVGRGGGGPDEDFLIARYNPNGSLDPSFSGDGRQTTDFGGSDEASGVAIQASGKIVVVGTGFVDGSGSNDFALARYNPNGSLDTSFSGDGRQTTDFVGFDQARAVAIQAGGKVIAVGTGRGSAVSPPAFALARYNSNGSLDATFSGDGKQTSGFGSTANAVALQGDGKIVAAGHAGTDFGLSRYNPNGSLDPSFSGDGLQTTDFGFGADDQATGVVLQPDGRIVAAGYAAGGATGNDFALARYNPNGSLDTSFSGDGKRRTNFGGSDRASGVALQANGRIVLAGGGLGPDQTSDFALARYLGG